MGRVIDENTKVPLRLVLVLLSGVAAGSVWVYSVNTQFGGIKRSLARIERKLGIGPTYPDMDVAKVPYGPEEDVN